MGLWLLARSFCLVALRVLIVICWCLAFVFVLGDSVCLRLVGLYVGLVNSVVVFLFLICGLCCFDLLALLAAF